MYTMNRCNKPHFFLLVASLCAVLTFAAGPAMTFFNVTAQSLHDAPAYARSVLPAAP